MENSYNKRVVRYEDIHSITPEQFDKFVDAIAPIDGEMIMDIGAGYGAVTREIIQRHPNLDIKYTLLEQSQMQIERSKQELANMTDVDRFKNEINFINSSILENHLEKEYYDKITAKCMIHEIPKHDKRKAFQNIHSTLKKGGKFLIWQYCLDKENRDLFNKLITKKDELAGYKTLVSDREFDSEDELFSLLEEAGFNSIKKEHEFNYHLNTHYRLESEFNGNIDTLREWNRYIIGLLENYDDRFIKEHKYSYNNDNIGLLFKQAVYLARK